METRVDDSDGAANSKKPRSMDLQTLYDQNPMFPIIDEKQNQTGSLKRKHGKIDVDSGLEKKKSKKEVLLSCLPSGKKIKKSLDEVYKGGSSSASSDLNKVESEPSLADDRADGFDTVSLNLGDDIRQIPKRKRDLVRRKKADASNRLEQEGTLGGKVSSSDVAADLNGGSKGKTGQDGEKKGKSCQNGNFNDSFGTGVNKIAKRREGFNGHKEHSSSKIDSLLFMEKENLNSHAPSDDPLSNKKAKRNRKPRKETIVKFDAAAEDAKPISHQFTRNHGNSLEDEEENLEENAARMLSSRFDPSCTGFSPNGKCPDSPFAIPSDRGDASHDSDLQSKSDVASGDTEVRVLRPRDQCKRKGHVRKRRHFYEVLAKDVGAFWMVQKKIKVYWPLDQIWYFGEVIGYDPKKLLHHIQYDDCEEEWIDLQNERFKLLLFPSELPFKAGRRGSGAGGKHHKKGKSDFKVQDDKRISSHIDSGARGENHTKGKSNAKVQDDNRISSHVDSEPIISWLSSSTGPLKSSPSGTSKKPKTSNLSATAHPSLSSTLAKGTASDIGSSSTFGDKLLSNPALPESSCGGEAGRTSLVERSSKFPVVYVRRRFRREKQGNVNASDDKLGGFMEEHLVYRTVSDSVDSVAVVPDRAHPTEIFDSSAGDVVSLKLPQFGDDLVILSLNTPVVNTEIYRYKLNFLPFLVPYYSFGVENLWIFHALMMLQHGTLMTLWPRVHLEMLFVDNFVGLRFLLFEGCLLQAIAFVFLILNVFRQSNQHSKHADEQLPVTSIRFQFSFLEDAMKRLFFVFHNFCRLETSRWVFLDHMLQKYGSVVKQLPPSECTYNNIKALEIGSIHLNAQSGSLAPSTRKGLRQTRQPVTCVSSWVNHSRSWVDMDGKWARLPPFDLSFSAAPTFFLSLHLKLLMERSFPCDKFNDGNAVSLPENGGVEQVDCCPGECNCNSRLHLCRTKAGKNVASVGREDVEIICKPSLQSQVLDDDCLNKCEGKMKSEQRDSLAQPSFPEDVGPPLKGKTTYCPLNGITVEIPLFNPQERPSNGGGNSQSSVLPSAVYSRGSTTKRSSWYSSKAGSSLLGNLSHALPEGKPDLLCSGPKKPRTQVSYSLPPEGHDTTTKFKTHHIKGFSHKRIRRTSEKRESDASRKFQRNMESFSCDGNLLVVMEDRGWRIEGARVVLEPLDDNECQLSVKISESTRYAYKANQFLQSGATNRYTHAMIWKGAKEWSLEFPDRSQWVLFKEMHEECYNRNFRAASVKNIPIPGVHLIEENDDNEVELPFVRPSTRYFRQLQTDVDIAMDSSHVLYDMDSDDELWMSKIRSSGSENGSLWNVSDEMFEKIMDKLEKFAYANQKNHFTPDELEELIVEGGSSEAIKFVYEHWLDKRRKKGRPLVRHLQPPLWEIYQQLVREWESVMSKCNRTVSSGFHEKAIEKPPMFAFCLKPRGLALRINRVTKHRSQKKLSVTGHGNLISGDTNAFHSYGRRFYGCASGEEKILYQHGSLDSPPLLRSSRDVGSPGYLSLNNDVHERIHYPRLYRTKSKKIGSLLYPNEEQVNQRIPSKRNGRQPRYYHPERAPRLSVEHLNPAELDEFRLRDASSAAQHAINVATMKKDHARRLLYKADLAIHKAAVAMMNAEALKASREATTNDSSSDSSST